MEKETFLSEVKEFAKSFISKHLVKEKFMKDAKLADGTLISYDAEEIAKGVVVFIVDTTGAKLPLPMGSYALEDGTTFDVVDNEGSADNVVKAEEKTESPEATPAMPEAQSAQPQMQTRTSPTGEPIPSSVIETRTKETKFSKEEIDLEFEVYEQKFNKAIEKVESEKLEFEKQVNELKEKAEKNEALVKEMFELVKKIAEYEGKKPEVPATETKTNPFNVKEWRKQYKEDLNNINK